MLPLVVYSLLTLVTPLLVSAYPSYSFPSLYSRQNTTGWTMNATDSSSALEGCVVLAQFTSTTPVVIQKMIPVCPSTVSDFASTPPTGMSIDWPFTTDGNASSSSLAIYGSVEHKVDRDDPYMAQAGCVMELSSTQAQYLVSRSLTWNNDMQELWDNTASGFVASATNGTAMTCGNSSTLLPPQLWLPCPYMFPASDPSFSEPLTITIYDSAKSTVAASTSSAALGGASDSTPSATLTSTSSPTIGSTPTSTPASSAEESAQTSDSALSSSPAGGIAAASSSSPTVASSPSSTAAEGGTSSSTPTPSGVLVETSGGTSVSTPTSSPAGDCSPATVTFTSTVTVTAT